LVPVQVRDAGTAVVDTGPDGTVSDTTGAVVVAGAVSVTTLETADDGPVPSRFVAETLKLKLAPAVRPVKVAVVTLPATVCGVPAGLPALSSIVTVYDVIAAPPSVTGGAQAAVAVEAVAVAAPMTGAPGTVADAPLHGVGSSGPTPDAVDAPSP